MKVIKIYQNGRAFDTSESSYISPWELWKLRESEAFIINNKTKENITDQVFKFLSGFNELLLVKSSHLSDLTVNRMLNFKS